MKHPVTSTTWPERGLVVAPGSRRSSTCGSGWGSTPGYGP